MTTIGDRLDRVEENLKHTSKRVSDNTTWRVQTTVKLNILFGVLTFLATTIGALIITLIFKLATNRLN